MNLTSAFIRKVVYLACMVPPLLVIVGLGMPAVRTSKTSNAGPTGYLAHLRDENNLSPAKLGEIDPASETMKLSTLGLRGVAVNMLWNEAHKYKKYKDFDNLSATVNQIVLLQPNFITVWEYQAHNLSYNVSVEFDDYRDRYSWVTKGISFLMSGTEYNRYEPRLHTSCGWFLGHKIGRSDEFRQFRRLFRHDEPFQKEINQYVHVDDARDRAYSLPDNWLVGRLWYLQAENLVETRNARVNQGPWLFFSQAPRSLINYAIGLDRDGELPPDEISQQAWRTAENGWDQYGKRELYTGGSEPVRLGDLDALRSIFYEARLTLEAGLAGLSDDELERFRADARPLVQGSSVDYNDARVALSEKYPQYREYLDAARDKKRAKLEPKLRAALDRDPELRSVEEQRLAEEADAQIQPVAEELVQAASTSQLEKVEALRGEQGAAKEKFNDADELDALSKYQYWKIRCQVEATKEAREAKRLLYQAKQMAEQARLTEEQTPDGKVIPGAKELYEQAWEKWGLVFNTHPAMYQNVEESQMLLFDLIEYDRVLSKLELPPLPYDFPLRRLIDVDTGLWTGRPIQPKPEVEPTDEPPADKPTDKPTDEAKPDEAKPAESKPAETKPAEPKADEPKPETERPSKSPPEQAKPAKTKPETAEPAKEQPKKGKPATDKPATEQPAAKEPAAEKPMADEPDKEKPKEEATKDANPTNPDPPEKDGDSKDGA